MCGGYLSQITFLLSAVQKDADILEGRVVDGETSGEVLQPLIQELGKSMDMYQKGMRTIKNVFVSSLHGCVSNYNS